MGTGKLLKDSQIENIAFFFLSCDYIFFLFTCEKLLEDSCCWIRLPRKTFEAALQICPRVRSNLVISFFFFFFGNGLTEILSL